jgi:hypothetical protein
MRKPICMYVSKKDSPAWDILFEVFGFDCVIYREPLGAYNATYTCNALATRLITPTTIWYAIQQAFEDRQKLGLLSPKLAPRVDIYEDELLDIAGGLLSIVIVCMKYKDAIQPGCAFIARHVGYAHDILTRRV